MPPTRRKEAWGRTSPAERAACPQQHRRPDRGEPRAAGLRRDHATTASRSARRRPPTCRWPSIISAISPAASAPRKAASARSTTTPSPITSTSRSASSAQIIPWNFPILMAAWKLAPALAAGNCVVLKPAEQTPMSIMVLMDLIGDLLPPGVLNVVNGFGVEAGKPLAQSKRIAKIAFTGETTTGRLIMQYASENLIPVTLELGGKSPNIFFADVMAEDDDFFDKALEGFAMFAFNQGEVCTCPSRALVQEIDLRPLHGAGARAGEGDQAGQPARSDDHDRRAGLQRSAREDPLLHRHRQAGRRQGADRRRARRCSTATSPAATTSSRRCSRATTRCASSRRRSSGRCSR